MSLSPPGHHEGATSQRCLITAMILLKAEEISDSVRPPPPYNILLFRTIKKPLIRFNYCPEDLQKMRCFLLRGCFLMMEGRQRRYHRRSPWCPCVLNYML